ncbi:MAG TPA: electron transporter RnfE [Nitrospiraceae bacterium]|nr:electron transporter RnfE [Nitrospiraceae bacterium]
MRLGWFFLIFLWVLVILSVLYLFQALIGAEKRGTGETAFDVLKKRYAKGKIAKEEFERIKDDILKR